MLSFFLELYVEVFLELYVEFLDVKTWLSAIVQAGNVSFFKIGYKQAPQYYKETLWRTFMPFPIGVQLVSSNT